MTIDQFTGPILVTVLYLALWYYLLLILQRGTKYRLQREYREQGKEFDRYFGRDVEMLAADRAVINTQEQQVPFLASLWLHAIFVSTTSATVCGLLYVFLRAIYPALLGKKVSKMQSRRVHFVTVPCYILVFYMLGSTVIEVLS